MKIEKIKDKLSQLFDLSDEKIEKEKHQTHLLEIIDKLKKKKKKLKEKIQLGAIDETTDEYADLTKQHKVVTKLLKKAKKQYASSSE
mgnify:CR=1 FL=1